MNELQRRDLLLSLKYSTVEASFSVPMLNLTMPNLPFAIALPWGFVAFLPAFDSPTTRLALFGVMLAVTTGANSFGSVAWSASIAELVPPRISGRFFGRRNLIFGFWTLLTVLVAGWTVEAAGETLVVFGAIYGLAAAARLIGLFFLHQMRFPASVMEVQRANDTATSRAAAWRDPSYRALIVYVGGWGLLVNMGLPFYTVFVLRHLGLSLGSVALLTTTGSLGGLLTLKAWGRLADHFGNKPVIRVCTVLWAVADATSWLAVTSGHTWHLYLNYLLVGAATAGFQLCQFNLMIRLAPPTQRADFISSFLSITSLLTALGPVLGGLFLATLPDVVGRFGQMEWRNYQVVFVLPLLAGLALTRALRRIHEPEEQPSEAVWKMMRSMKTFNPLLGMSTAVEFLFTPRGMLGLARTSVRSLRRQARNLTDVGSTILTAGQRGARRGNSATPKHKRVVRSDHPPGT